MDKIVAREVNPSDIDFRIYFGDEAFTEKGGENCAIYIPGDAKHTGFNCNDYIERVGERRSYCFSLLDGAVMAKRLTKETGKEWTHRSFTGYSQGDYCQVVYCKEKYGDEVITEVGKFWLGCGTEFIIDDVGGYFVIDDVRWQEGDTLRNALANMSGYAPEQLEIHLYAGEHKVTDYKLME